MPIDTVLEAASDRHIAWAINDCVVPSKYSMYIVKTLPIERLKKIITTNYGAFYTILRYINSVQDKKLRDIMVILEKRGVIFMDKDGIWKIKKEKE